MRKVLHLASLDVGLGYGSLLVLFYAATEVEVKEDFIIGLHLQTVIRLKLGLLFYQFRSMLNSRYGVVQKQVPSDVAMQYGQVTKPAKKPF